MSKIQIPEKHMSGVETLSLISDNEFNVIFEILEEYCIGQGIDSFVSLFSEKAKFDNSAQVAQVIFTTVGLLADGDFDIESLSKSMSSEYMTRVGHGDEQQEEKLKNRLFDIYMNSSSIITTYQANILTFDSNLVVYDSKVKPNIHIINNKSSDGGEQYGIILHKVKLSFNGDDGKSVYTFDREELNNLKRSVQAALDEEDIIKKKYSNLINFIEITN